MNEQRFKGNFKSGKIRNSKAKSINFYSFMIGILISVIICAYANAQLTDNTETTTSYITDVWATGTRQPDQSIESTESQMTEADGGITETITTTTNTRQELGNTNQQTQRVEETEGTKNDTSNTEVGKVKKVLEKGFPEDSIATITNTIYYNELGWDGLLTFKGENGSHELTRQSDRINNYGKRERSFGQCQLMEAYHAPFIWKDGYAEIRPGYYKVSNPSGFTDDFLDPVKHANYCVSVYKDAQRKGRLSTTFYAYNHRWQYKNLFTLITE